MLLLKAPTYKMVEDNSRYADSYFYSLVTSMSFYPDFILISSWFYPDFIQILFRFYSDFIQIKKNQNTFFWNGWNLNKVEQNTLSRFNLDFILILSGFYLNEIWIKGHGRAFRKLELRTRSLSTIPCFWDTPKTPCHSTRMLVRNIQLS